MAALGSLVVQVGLDLAKLKSGEIASSETILKLQNNVEKMATSVQASSDRAAASIDRGLQRSLIETTAAMQGFTRGSAGFAEVEAKIKGIQLNPDLLNSLKALEAQQKANIAANTNHTQSAKELGFALRNVPAQFSDIVISLQGGQKPLTVFLQQGAQLKDLFGGAGNAARALGGYILGLISPFTLAAAAATGLAAAYASGANESTRLSSALISSGNLAAENVGHLNDLAGTVGALTGHYGAAREAVQALATSGVFTGDQLTIALDGVVAGAELTGKSIDEVTKQFASLAKDPVQGLLQLNDQYHFLTYSTYKQIEALEKQGSHQEAVTLAMITYSDAVKSRASDVVTNLGWIERGWLAIKRATDSAIDSAKNVGRTSSIGQQIIDAQTQLSNLQARFKQQQGFGGLLGVSQSDIQAAQDKLNGLMQSNITQSNNASAKAALQLANDNKINRDKAYQALINDSSTFSSKDLQNKQIQDVNDKFNALLKQYDSSTEEYKNLVARRDQAIKNINDKAAAPGQRKADSAAARALREAQAASKAELDSFQSLLGQVKDKNAQYEAALLTNNKVQESDKEQIKLNDLLANSHGALNEKVKAKIVAETEAQIAVMKLNEATTQARISHEQYAAALASSLQTSLDTIQTEKDRVDAVQRQIDVFGLSEKAVSNLEAAKLDDAAASYAQSIAMMQANGASEETIKWTEAQIQALRDLATAKRQFGTKSDELDKLKEAKKVNDEFWKSIEGTAHSVWTSVWQDGSNAFKNIGKTIKSSILDVLYQITVKKWIIGLSLSATGASASQAIAGTGVSSSGGGIGSIFSSLGNIISSGNGSIVNSIESLGSFLANGNGGILDKIGGFIGGNASSIANGAGYIGAALQMLQGNVLGGLGAGVGTFFGGPLGGAVGSFIGSTLGSIFGLGHKKTKGDYTYGQYSNGQFSSLNVRGLEGGGSIGARGALDSLNQSFSEQLGGVLKAFGVNDSFNTYSGVKANKKGNMGYFSAIINGQNVGDGVSTYRNFGGEDPFQKIVADAFGSTFVAALQASSLKANVKKYFNGLTDATAVGNAVNGLLALKSSLGDMPAVFDSIRRAIESATDQTPLAQLQTNFNAIQTYTTLFYSQQEQFDTLTRRLTTTFSSLNESLPETRDGFRKLVDGLDTTTAAGLAEFNALVSLAPTMDQYYKAIEQQNAALEAATQSQRAGLDSFTSLVDYRNYLGLANNYGTNFAQDFVGNANAGNITWTAGGQAMQTSDGNTELVALLKELRNLTTQNLRTNRDAQNNLQRIDYLGVGARPA